MAASKFSVRSFDLKHYAKTEAYARAVQALFDSATRDIMHMKQIGTFDPNKPFRWEDYPQAKAIMEQITLQLATRVVGTIERGSRDEWVSSCKKNDAYLEHIMNTSKLSKKRLSQMQDRRLEALDAFQGRKVNGLDLSQRVWKYVNQYKQNLEDGIDLGLGVGTSADVLSREVRKYLADPDMYFRRFRVKVGTDENGQTVYGRKWKRMIKTPDGNIRWIDEAPKDYHPGAGKYRSSYKNAMRLARSEINMAYRESDWERWQQLDFVVGFEIHRSNHRPEYKCKLCERLKGKYPKNFKFVGWHPHCRCYVTPIIMDDETFNNNEVEDLRAAIRGTEAKHDQAKNAVVKMPENFTKWAEETAEKVANGEMHIKNVPYFVRDNFIAGDIEQGVRPDVEQYDPLMTLSEAQSIVEQVIKSHTMPKGLSEEQQKAWVENEQCVSKELGIKQSEPMSFDDANESRGNPHYIPDSDDGYTINCQSCVVANELRRRGWDVEALFNTKQADNIPHQLSHKTNWAWIDPKTGAMPKKTYLTGRELYDKNMQKLAFDDFENAKYQGRKFSVRMLKEQLDAATKEVGRYHLDWRWKSHKEGHIITVERLEDGTLRFYDPQTGKVMKWSDYKDRISQASPVGVLRVDTLEPNTDIINRVVAKAGSTKPLSTPVEVRNRKYYETFLKLRKQYGGEEALRITRKIYDINFADNPNGWSEIRDYMLEQEMNNATLGDRVTESKMLFEQYDEETWHRVHLDKKSGGYVVEEKSRVKQAQKSKQERMKYEKEKSMCEFMAQKGHRVEFLNDRDRADGSYDIRIDGLRADLKQMSSANNIIKKAKDAIKRQKAEIVVFEFTEKNEAIIEKIHELQRKGFKFYYYFKGESKLYDCT